MEETRSHKPEALPHLRVLVLSHDASLGGRLAAWLRAGPVAGHAVEATPIAQPCPCEPALPGAVVLAPDALAHLDTWPLLAGPAPPAILAITAGPDHGPLPDAVLEQLPLTELDPPALRRSLGFAVRLHAARRGQDAAPGRPDAHLDSRSDGILVVDAGGRIAFANAAAERILDRPAAALVGRPAELGLAADGARDLTLVGRDGRPIPAEARVFECRWRGAPARTVLLTDISERVRQARALRSSEERYALAVAGANDGLWDWDIARDQVYFSPRFKAILGLAEAGLEPARAAYHRRVHPEDRGALTGALFAHLQGRAGHFESEHRVRSGAGEYRWVLLRGLVVRDAANVAVRMAGSLTDLHERKLLEQRLAHNAFHDTLTGLPNRALFLEQLARSLRKGRRSAGLAAVLFLDFDRFKSINDTLGHQVGDGVLVELGRRLAASVRPGDVVARLSGDEFTVLLDDLGGEEEARQVAERILQALSQPMHIDGHGIQGSASIGVALGDAASERPESLLREADSAMYHAKLAGGGRYVVFDAGMRSTLLQRLRIETELATAIGGGQLRLHYQPIVCAREGTLRGFEALVRWDHPDIGLLEPAEFIPVAEETGHIHALSRWVLERACAQIRAWSRRPGAQALYVNVNLSAKDFLRPDLAREVNEAIERAGITGRQLNLELTETALLGNLERAARVSEQLRALGVRIFLDDFGTGYSSLSHLHRLPVDALKIDSSFISGPRGIEDEPAIARSIIALARALHIEVVAEGVETAGQEARLRELECDQHQGRFVCPPVDAEAATRLVAARAGRLA